VGLVVSRSGPAGLALAALLLAVPAGRAEAASVTVSNGDGCVERDAITEQATEILGQPLGAVTGVDFEVMLTRAPGGGWKLRLDTVDQDANDRRRSRELVAATCAELADAAAVAIAMTVRSRADAPAAAAPEAPALPPVLPPTSSVPGPKPVVARAPAEPASPLAFAAGLAVVGDGGALPHPGAGIELGASVRHRRVRLRIAGTVLASQVTHTTSDAGGEFRLIFGSAEGCLAQPLGRTTLLGCTGFELGRLSGEGVGVFQPRLGAARWQAAVAELALSIPVAARVAVLVRAGGALPLSRPEFVVNGETPVHQPASLTARVAVGAELEF
jgi:hypothetical protein